MALGLLEMNHCHVSLPWGGRSSKLTSPEPHSKRSKPQANRPIMVVGLPGEVLPLVERQESILLLPVVLKTRRFARDEIRDSRVLGAAEVG